jgi:hypothetical protein
MIHKSMERRKTIQWGGCKVTMGQTWEVWGIFAPFSGKKIIYKKTTQKTY